MKVDKWLQSDFPHVLKTLSQKADYCSFYQTLHEREEVAPLLGIISASLDFGLFSWSIDNKKNVEYHWQSSLFLCFLIVTVRSGWFSCVGPFLFETRGTWIYLLQHLIGLTLDFSSSVLKTFLSTRLSLRKIWERFTRECKNDDKRWNRHSGPVGSDNVNIGNTSRTREEHSDTTDLEHGKHDSTWKQHVEKSSISLCKSSGVQVRSAGLWKWFSVVFFDFT